LVGGAKIIYLSYFPAIQLLYQSSNNNNNNRKSTKGSLVIVGSGIQAVRHFTLEARQSIEQADKVLYSVVDPITEMWIKKINPNAESLADYYEDGKPRIDTYRAMNERTLYYVREGLNVCVVYYGHTGVFVDPSHESIRVARKEGFNAQLLPGISAEDCLFADLNIDPSIGCQSFEATSFLVRKWKFDTSSHLILWQIGVIGEFIHKDTGDYSKHGLTVLVDYLKHYYDADHEVIVYQAAQYAIYQPIIQRVLLSKLSQAQISVFSTLYVPPKEQAPLDYGMVNRLGLLSELQEVKSNPFINKLFRFTHKK
jgi:uncharacterized protein YabN with tetrapyrrole methylase and pyrophosphatase domain